MDLDKASVELKNGYISIQLKNVYKLYFGKFDTSDKKNIINALSDSYITKLMVKVLSNESLFNKFFNTLPKDVRDIMYYLIWENEEVNQTELLKDFQIDISARSSINFNPYDYIEKVQDKYHLFSIEKYYDNVKGITLVSLSLPSILKKIVRPFFKQKPKAYNLTPYENIKETEYTYQNNYEIVNDINSYFKLLENKKDFVEPDFFDSPKLSKNDLKFLLEVSKDKTDFFNLKNVEFTKNSILLQMSYFFYKNYKVEKLANIALLKEIVNKLENNTFLLSYNLLNNLGGKNTLKTSYANIAVRNRSFVKSLFFVLKELKTDNWYDIKEIISFINLRDLDIDIFAKVNIENLYINYTDEYKKKEKKYFSKKSDYKNLFIIPLIKSMFFLFSSLGLIDIKYNKSSNELSSIFDGLNYIKLNHLGSYLLGLSESFDFKVSDMTKTSQIIIEEDDLSIKIKGEDKAKEIYLESFAEKISSNLFVINYSSFLKNCNSKKDIESKINLFKKEFNDNPPKIWNDFFSSVLNKFTPLEIESELVIYKVPNNKELIDILFKDDVIKNLIIKVEGLRIAISKDNISRLKKRLEYFGFVI